MINPLLAFGVYAFLFSLLFVSVMSGYRFAIWQMGKEKQTKLGVIKIAEGTVFALLGLLIAFTFSSSYERFENRKILIITEANAIETVNLRIGLLPAEMQPPLRTTLHEYVQARLHTYDKIPDMQAVNNEIEKCHTLATQLWNQAIDACKAANVQATTLLLIPAINNLFEIANTRIDITHLHAPGAIFFLLIGLAVLASFLVGYSMAKNYSYSMVYILIYVAVTALTIYIIIDLEFPRVGLIKVNSFDTMLIKPWNYSQ